MRDDPATRRAVPGLLALLILGGSAGWAARAHGADLRGSTQIQYQKVDHPGTADDREIWLSGVQVDVTRRFEDRFDLSAQFLFRGVSYAGRAEGTQTPRGSLRLTHRYFGATGMFRPVRITDPLGTTSRQDELQFSAYTAREGWPSVHATWLRRSNQSGLPGVATTVGLARSLSASHTLGRFSAHAGYSDQARRGTDTRVLADERRTLTGGATATVGSARANLTAQYDVSETRRYVAGDRTERLQYHSASLNGLAQHSARHVSSLAYAFRRSTAPGYGTPLDDHEGSALSRYALTSAISLSGGGGLRSLRNLEGRDVQWYLVATGSAEGAVRPGWTAGAGISRSMNWVQHDRARPIDTYQAHTRMRFADGIELSGAGQVNVTDSGGGALTDSIGRSASVVSQVGGALTVRPLRSISAVYSRRAYRSGTSLTHPVSTSSSEAWDLRWTPAPVFQLTGSVARTRNLGAHAPSLLVRQATAQWTPSRRVELSGGWWRSDEERSDPGAALPPGRETLGGRLLLGLTRDLKTILLYSVVDPGRATEATRLEATATLGFGR